LATEVAAKCIELLHELLPTANSIAYFVNPTNTIDTQPKRKLCKLPPPLWKFLFSD
jgi:ABC-type uncharacterized transport system substrate-binding protein